MFLARRSRTIKGFSRGENRRWATTALISTITKSQHLSEEVYLAMVSRGYQGETRVLNDFHVKRQDVLWIAFSLITAVILFWCNIL